MPRMRLAGRLIAAWLAGATISCQDTLKPSPPGSGVAPVAVAYVCGNDFDLQSLHPAALTAQYAVAGTSEQGDLVLPPRSAESTPSTTRLTTLHRGTLKVSYRNEEIASISKAGVVCPPASVPKPQATSICFRPARCCHGVASERPRYGTPRPAHSRRLPVPACCFAADTPSCLTAAFWLRAAISAITMGCRTRISSIRLLAGGLRWHR